MHKLEIQTRYNKKEVEEPIDARIRAISNFNTIEILDGSGKWRFLYRFFSLKCPEEQKQIQDTILKELKESIVNKKSHVFIDV